MEAQTAVTAPEQPLHERLASLRQRQRENMATFMGRAAHVAGEYPDHLLTDLDIEHVEHLLPSWQIGSARIYNRPYTVARRVGWALASVRDTLSDYNVPEERIVSVQTGDGGESAMAQRGEVVLLAKGQLDSGDLEAMFQIEQANAQGEISSNVKRFNSNNGGRKLTKANTGKQEKWSLLLTPDNEKVIDLWPLPKKEAARRLRIQPESIDSCIAQIRKNNHMITREELIEGALGEGLINLDLLPPPREYELSELQLRLVKEHAFSSLADTATALKLHQYEVSRQWGEIYPLIGATLDTRTRTHAYLILRRDGVL